MSLSELERLGKDIKEINSQINKTTERIHEKKNMNQFHWNERIKLMQDKKRTEGRITDIWKNL